MISFLKSNLNLYKSFIIYFIGLILTGGLNFLLIPLIVKLCGVSSYGEYSIFQNIVLIIISFSSGWLSQCVLRFNDRSTRFLFSLYELYFYFIIPSCLIGSILIFFQIHDLVLSVISFFSIFLGGLWAIKLSFYQSESKSKMYVFSEFIRVVVFFIGLLVLSNFAISNLYKIVIALLLSQVLPLSIVYKGQWRRGVSIAKKNRFSLLKKKWGNYKLLFFYGWPLALWFSISSILNVIDRYIIKYYYTAEEVGVYASVYDIIYKGITICFAPLLTASYPFIVKKYKESGRLPALRYISMLAGIEFFLFGIIFVFAYFFGSNVLSFFLKIPLQQINELLFPVLFGAFFWQLAMLGHKILELDLKTYLMLCFVSLALILNIILNILFIPLFGYHFAGYATIISACFYLLLCLIYSALKF